MENQGFKEYNDVLERYEELLEETAKRILNAYNKKMEQILIIIKL